MNRRKWLQTISAAPVLPAFAAAADGARVTVTGLEMFRVKVNRRGGWVLARLSTSAGVTGIGDASHGGREELVMSLARQLFDQLKGRSIFEIEWLRQQAQPVVAQRGRPAAVAFGSLEQCLWDIRGKVFGVPVSSLFGGRLRSKIRNYANINRSTEDRAPEGFAKMAEAGVKAGFDAFKLAPFDDMPRMDSDPTRIEEYMRLAIERAKAVRAVIGPDRDLLLDVHSHMDLQRGLDLVKRLEPLNLFWAEEVSRPLENLAAINKAAKMPTAGGESIYGVESYYRYISAGAVDIVMPDIKYCGGLLELKKIAAMAEGAGLPTSPHGPASPVGNAAAAQVCTTLPNFQILEFSFGEVPWRAELIDPPEDVVKGYLTPSDRPGFGITLNEKTIKKHAIS